MSRGQTVATVCRKRPRLSVYPATVQPRRHHRQAVTPEANAATIDRAGSVRPVSGSTVATVRRRKRTRRHHRKRRPFDRAGSVRRIPANVSERRKRASRPPFDRAPRLSIRQAVANIEHAAPPDSGKPSATIGKPRRIPASRGDRVPRPASDSPPPSASLSGKPSAVRPWRTSNTPRRRKCAAGFRQAVATVRPCAACQSIRQAVRHHRPRRRIRHHRKRATVRPCRKCAAGFRRPCAASRFRPVSDSGEHRNAATIGSGQPFDRAAGFATIAGNAA